MNTMRALGMSHFRIFCLGTFSHEKNISAHVFLRQISAHFCLLQHVLAGFRWLSPDATIFPPHGRWKFSRKIVYIYSGWKWYSCGFHAK